MIEVDGLTKKYGRLTAVDGVSFTVGDGECFALLGLNGAGKTTLIDMLSTQKRPTGGRATVGGFDLLSQREEERNSNRVAFLIFIG